MVLSPVYGIIEVLWYLIRWRIFMIMIFACLKSRSKMFGVDDRPSVQPSAALGSIFDAFCFYLNPAVTSPQARRVRSSTWAGIWRAKILAWIGRWTGSLAVVGQTSVCWLEIFIHAGWFQWMQRWALSQVDTQPNSQTRYWGGIIQLIVSCCAKKSHKCRFRRIKFLISLLSLL